MERAWRLVVGLVAAHSLLLGLTLLVAPLPVLEAFGWGFEGSRFFPAQSGLFLVILGVVYARAVRRRSLAWIIVLSKALAVLFLVSEAAAGHAPAMVYATAAADGLMGLAVLVLLRTPARESLSPAGPAGE